MTPLATAQSDHRLRSIGASVTIGHNPINAQQGSARGRGHTLTSDPSQTFGATQSLTVLLTTESLMFAVFAFTPALTSGPIGRTMLARTARKAATAAAAVLTVLGAGAAAAWVNLFLVGDWPAGFLGWFPVVAILAGIVAQPIFAWVFVAKIWRK